MEFTHQIILPHDAWLDFVETLNRNNYEGPYGIDSFFAEMAQDMNIWQENNNTFVETSTINEEDVIAALTAPAQRAPDITAVGGDKPFYIEKGYQIWIKSDIDLDDFPYQREEKAKDWKYHTNRRISTKKAFLYETVNTQQYFRSA